MHLASRWSSVTGALTLLLCSASLYAQNASNAQTAGAVVDTAASMKRLRSTVDSSVAARLAEGVPGLVVGVFRDTVPLYVQSGGRSVMATGRAYDRMQPQPIGSITKQFTAVAVLDLAERKMLALDDSIGRWFADMPAPLTQITVRQLLNQTSGLGRYEARFAFASPSSADTVVRTIVSLPLAFAPGSRFAYNNANYYLLGEIIRRVTGDAWHEQMRRRFFEPLGMQHTSPCSPVPADSLVGYMRAGGTPAARLPIPEPMTGAAGALCSTVHDLARWAGALHGSRLLSAEAYRLLHTPAVLPDSAANSYGMGMVRANAGSLPWWWHNGALTSGFYSQLAYYPADGLTVVVLANAFPAELEAVDAAIYRAWRGQ